jgi:hypothetical protein
MIGLSRCVRISIVVVFFAAGAMAYGQFAQRSEQETEGVLKGEFALPAGIVRPHPFILAYSATYGEQVLPVEERSLTARFDVKLKPGTYYLFVALDGYEPTCHVADILAGEVVLYNPKLGKPITIIEYTVKPKKVDLQTPLRHVQSPTVTPIPPQ